MHPKFDSETVFAGSTRKKALIDRFTELLQHAPAVFITTQLGEDFFGLVQDETTNQILLLIDKEFWTRVRAENPETQFMLLFRWLGNPAISPSSVGSLASESINAPRRRRAFVRDYHTLQAALDAVPDGSGDTRLDQLAKKMHLESIHNGSTRLSGMSANGITPPRRRRAKAVEFFRAEPFKSTRCYRPDGSRIPASDILLEDFKHGNIGMGLSAYIRQNY